MTAPIDEEEVVVSLRLQPVVARPDGWRGRSSGLIAAGLVGFIVFGLALGAAVGDRRPASPAAAVVPAPPVAISPTASRSPNPTSRPRLSPLPRVQVIGGEIPTERRLVYANGMQVLDLATGELTTPARPYEDQLLSLGDEVVCACMIRRLSAGDGGSSSVVLQFERLDASGTSIVERDVMTFDGVVEVPEMSPGFTMVAALGTDHQYLYVLTAVRRPPAWVVELHQVDVSSGELIASTTLDELPVGVAAPHPAPADASPTPRPEGVPPDGVYIWANWLAMSPDGGFAAASLSYSEARGDTWTSGLREWMVPLTEGRAGSVIAFNGDAQIASDSWCLGAPEFITSDLLVQVCTAADASQGQVGYVVRRVNTAGRSLGTLAIPQMAFEDRYQPSAAVDRTLHAVLTWDPVRHTLTRVSTDDGTVLVREVARSMLPDPVPSNNRGYFGADPGVVVSPDGRRVYALGFGLGPSDSGTSTGVWVFDAESLDLIDHWPPRAMLTSLAVSADGRFVYAAGANGFDVEGIQTQWPASVSVYDAQTGAIQVIYGAVSDDAWVSFRPLP